MFRQDYEPLEQYLRSGKVLLIYGARCVCKMSLLQKYLKYPPLKYKLDFGDNIRTQHILGSQNLTEFLPDAEGYELLAIDEAQNSRRLPGFCAALGKIRTYSK